MLERAHVLVCGGTGCTSGGGKQIYEEFKKQIKANGLEGEIKLLTTGCFGLCARGPIVVVYPDGAFYGLVKPEDVEEIVKEHLLKGRIVQRLISTEKDEEGLNKSIAETAFYKSQKRIVLRNCGVIDPENIDEYLAFDGYKAYEKAAGHMTRTEVIDCIKKSGLRGRGGAGFPTGLKWQFTFDAPGSQKYVVCNADEGDPGAFMDRSILEGDPHALIEAMMIAGYAVGADKGYIYVRAEYPIAIRRLEIAIEQAMDYGILGKNAMGLGHSFDIELRLGAGAFVCGCDSIAHRQTLMSNGKTVAILPSPLNAISPARNKGLAYDIVEEGGLLVTEYGRAADTKWDIITRYKERDRLQALFCDTIVLAASYAQNSTRWPKLHGQKLDSGARLAMGYAKDYSIPRAVMYDEYTDNENPMFDLNRDLIKEDAMIIDSNNRTAVVQQIMSKKVSDFNPEPVPNLRKRGRVKSKKQDTNLPL